MEVQIFCSGDVGSVRNHHSGSDDLGFFSHSDDHVCGYVYDLDFGDDTFQVLLLILFFNVALRSLFGIALRIDDFTQ